MLTGYKIAEKIYDGLRTVVYRGRREADDKAVIIKILKNEYPTFNELLQFRNQYAIALNLDLPGVVQPLSLERYGNGYALIMEDIGAISLEEYAAGRSLNLKEVLTIGISIVEILEGLYQHRVIHKDIKPSNILINPETKEIKLIDLSISTLLPRENQEVQNPNLLEGTLAYMSPEQTGRMNRGIDYRTDFYSLGVSLYELLVGELPFESNDPMELIHSHIARKAMAPTQIKPEIPKTVSNILLKLMAKTPEQRYQSARGILCDLQTCWEQWETTGKIGNFLLGQRDKSDRFVIPEKLYGRETEVQTLLNAFDRVSAGKIQMMLVAGFSGIGKTALVNEVHKPIVQKRGYFIAGKFDQFKRNIPFSALAQAFSGLMGQLLSESAEAVEGWKGKILEAVGEQGQVIIDVIPELERIIGKQPTVTELDAAAAQNRFNLLFQKFIRVFPTAAHPLVIFLDDLQWADSASLKLMQLLMKELKVGHLLLIGAYRDVARPGKFSDSVARPGKFSDSVARPGKFSDSDIALAERQEAVALAERQEAVALAERQEAVALAERQGNEVSATHPLMLSVREMEKSGAAIARINLTPLDESSLNSLVADALCCSRSHSMPLTKLVYQKTRGNPFFATQFLKSLREDGLIQFDFASGYWQCDMSEAIGLSLTSDVVEFMALQLQKLPEATLEVLKVAACIGDRFDLETLAIAIENPLPDTAVDLWKALEAGLILPLGQIYKFYQEEARGNRQEAIGFKSPNSPFPKYKFLHDRVRQAAYSLIAEEDKPATHLKIGRLLLNKLPEAEREEKIFDLVNQLNYGVELITEPEERQMLARLNLAAGIKAKAATAYSAAVEYFAVGRELLVANCWQNQYELALALHESAAEAAYLNGEFEEMERLVEEVLRGGRSLLERVKAYEVKLQAYAVRNQFVEAIETAFYVLKLLGVSFPESPTDTDIQQAFAETKARWSDRQIEELIQLPEMDEPEKIVTLRILGSITATAYIALPQFLPLIVCEQVKLSIDCGNAPWSAYSYSIYGTILCGVADDIESGYQFGKLAISLLSKFNVKEITAKVTINTDGDIRHWKEPARETIKPLLWAYQTGVETGDIEFAAYCAFYGCYNSYLAGTQLIELQKQVATYSQAFLELKQETAFSWSEIHRQGILNLIEPTVNPGCLVGEAYNEEKSLSLHQQVNDRLALHIIYSHKLILCYLFGRLEEGLENAAKAENYLDGVTAMLAIPVFYLYDSLARLRCLNDLDSADRETQLKKVAANQKKMQKWAFHAPMNHGHKYNLVEAERYRVVGEDIEAMKSYDRAIAGAKENGYIQEEALANELAANFYLEWGNEKIAQVYIGDAYYAYARWGAKAKVEDLESRYGELLRPLLVRQQTNFAPETTTSRTLTSSIARTTTGTGKMLDLSTAIAAARAVSGELELDKLLSSLMETAIENAGAEVGYFIMPKGDELVIEAAGAIVENKVPEIKASLRVSECEEIPQSIINYVHRTENNLIIDNATKNDIFYRDPYILWRQPQSVLCAPIKNQGKLIGIIYLENNLATGAFTSDRIELLNLLCSQAGISLENARLYQNSQNYAQQLKDSLEELQQAQLQLVQSEKMSALGQLVAGVAHEINNPLGFIVGNLECASDYVKNLLQHLQLYQEYYPQPVSEIQQNAEEIDLDFLVEDLPKAIESITIGSEIIRNLSVSLRTFSRADTVLKVSFNIHEGIDSTLLILKHRLKANEQRGGIEVVKNYGELPPINCYAGQLNQVFMNILANAIDAFDEANSQEEREGGQNDRYSITISTQFYPETGKVTVKIKDNGPGIPTQVKMRIFDNLFTTKAVGKGTGLGLSISRQIIEEKHGGNLRVISSLGEGAEFIIEIPADG